MAVPVLVCNRRKRKNQPRSDSYRECSCWF